jgi:hypothetical protein
MADESELTLYYSAPIDVDTWNKAMWLGVLYVGFPDGKTPPLLGLLFQNELAGRKVFTDWRAKIGPKDEKEDLRVAIIEGAAPGREPGYFVHIGPDPDRVMERAKEQGYADPRKLVMGLVSRVHRMNPPPGSPNLANFKKEVARHERYGLVPVFLRNGNPTPDMGLVIEKSKIHFRLVEEVGADDIDKVCFSNPNAASQ